MRRILGIVGGALVATMFASGPAWAGDDKSEKRVKVELHEENVLEVDGLEPELVERAVEALRAHHPGVQVKAKEGRLRVSSTDGHAFHAALGALKELGLPMDVSVGGRWPRIKEDGAGPKDGPPRAKKPRGDGPSDQAFEKQIGMLEQKLEAAREAGREREVQELEKALQHLRQVRKEARAQREQGGDVEEVKQKHREGREAALQALRTEIGALEKRLVAAREGGREREVAEVEQALEHMRAKVRALKGGEQGPNLADLRERMERAKREMRGDMEEPRGPREGRLAPRLEVELHRDNAQARRLVEALGERREHSGPPGELRARMQHVRQAMEHLRAAGLGEHAQRLEIALHRMELAAEGQGGPRAMGPQGKGPEGMGPRRMGPGGMGPDGMGAGGPGPQHVGPQRRGPGGPDGMNVPPPPMAPRKPAPQLGTLPEGPPPSVGGVRRGPIHVRPRVIAPQDPQRTQVQTMAMERFLLAPHDGKSFRLGEKGAARLFHPEDGERAVIVVEGAGGSDAGRRVVKLGGTDRSGVFVLGSEDGREVRIERGGPGPKSVPTGVVRPPPVPVVKVPRPQPAQAEAQRQVEELRAQVEQLRQQLERVLRELSTPK